MRTGLLLAAALTAACSGTSTAPDGGARDGGGTTDGGTVNRPVVTVTANPPTADVGQLVTFTASITAGTPPYRSCVWRFSAGAGTTSGALAGSTCTGQATYSDPGPKAVSVDVTDNAGRVGTGTLQYDVGADGGAGTGPDLVVKAGTMALVNAPEMNRYPQGSNIQIRFTVRNAGTSSAGASAAEVSLKNLFDNSLTVLGNAPIGSLAGGAEQTVMPTFTISPSQAQGSYTISIRVDANDAVAEENENNTFSDPTNVNFAITSPDGGA
jgi:hypothetical protein